MIPVEVRNQKAIESAEFVRAKICGARHPDAEDVFQEAVLWALEWAERYGAKCEGNPFTIMTRVGMRRALLAAGKRRHIESITEHGLRSEWPASSVVPIADCGGDEREGVAVQVEDETPPPELLVAGEGARRRRVARLLAELDPGEQRLVRAAISGRAPALRALADRCGLSRKHARRVLRRLAAALGSDPVAAPARARALDQRLPAPGSVLRRRIGEHCLACLITDDGFFEYGGRRYGSLSAAAFDASRDAGRPRVAVNGFEFWGIAGSARVISDAWKTRKSAVEGTLADTSRPRTRAATCAPSATSPSPKPPRKPGGPRPASTCGSARAAAVSLA